MNAPAYIRAMVFKGDWLVRARPRAATARATTAPRRTYALEAACRVLSSLARKISPSPAANAQT